MDPITLTTIGTIGTLASVVIQLWSERRRLRRTALDQELLERLVDARREHAREIQCLRVAVERTGERSRVVVKVAGEVARLEEDALFLNAMGFDVIFEEVDGGYGLALPLSEEGALVLWLPPGYPSEPPEVLVWQPPVLERIPFESGSWDETRYLAEVVAVIYHAFSFAASTDGGGAGDA